VRALGGWGKHKKFRRRKNLLPKRGRLGRGVQGGNAEPPERVSFPVQKGSREVYNYSTTTNFVGIDCSARRVRRASQGKIRFCFRRKIPEFAPITI